ncbi:MAG: FecR family protein [Elusimicrobia bacterium]|nr:FecR family protein [Elusimicrobiota bacterium]
MKRCLPAALLVAALCARASAAIMLVPHGAVELRTGDGPWAPVTGSVEMVAGQEVLTGTSGSALISFPDGSRIALGFRSQFKVENTDRKETMLSLSLGKLRAAFAGFFSSRVAIRTPTAVVAVRGTVFGMGVDAKSTEVNMAEGVLEVKDQRGHQAVVTSEETVTIGQNGMEMPHQVGLNDKRALDAVRPLVVNRENARDATRRMLEELRNRELKANEAQLGKDAIDAFGRRVRLEEYLLRPDNKSFEMLFLSRRADRFDWGHILDTFNSVIPDDMSQVPAIIAGTFLSKTQPSNWLKSMDYYMTNTVDAERELITLGNPVQIDFSGYFNHAAGTAADFRYYPQSFEDVQTLYGPGVPGGARVQFDNHQDFGQTAPNLFTWTQQIVNNVGTLALLDQFQMDPSDKDDVLPGVPGGAACNSGLDTCIDHSPDPYNVFSPGYPGYLPEAQFNGFIPAVASYPSGSTKADYKIFGVYPDGSTVAVEKFLVSNGGDILDTANATAATFRKEGSYNLEINLKSSWFQGRDIDVLIAPEILHQQKTGATTADGLQPQ